MLIALIGESCAGKSTIAALLKEPLSAAIYSGRDYLRLAKNEAEAETRFKAMLAAAVAGEKNMLYVISERAQLALLPPGTRRVHVTAPPALIRERFAARMGGALPPPVERMLEARHGMFDGEPCALTIDSAAMTPEEAARAILAL
ncbi:MAG: hypothetical protein Q4C13_08805 [Clostridia bacterium]|nr:hypothetical protein [Clostridia bacterium]